LLLVRLGFVALPVLLIILISAFASAEKARLAKLPGYAAYQIAENNAAPHGGNSPEARDAARGAATMMETFRSVAIQQSSKAATLGKPIKVWCELHGDRCLFIIKVPSFRKYTSEAKRRCHYGGSSPRGCSL
jgi:hypothetical protein